MKLSVTEKQVQTAVKKFLREMGAAVYDTSQPFRAAITPGVPDLIVMYRGRFMFVECKAPGGKLTAAQEVFRDECYTAHVRWECWRSVEDAVKWATSRRPA